MDYLIRHEGLNKFTVIKWDNSPIGEYHLFHSKSGWKCSCPVSIFRNTACKHIEMAKECIRKGLPQPFIIESEVIK